MNWHLFPEVAGELGRKTKLDNTVFPPIVKRLHCEFHGWLGDDLLESFPCFVVTSRLVKELETSNLTGFTLVPLEVTTSDLFRELHPGLKLPSFSWLQVTGKARVDDFAISERHALLVSDGAMHVLRRCQLDHCVVERVNAHT